MRPPRSSEPLPNKNVHHLTATLVIAWTNINRQSGIGIISFLNEATPDLILPPFGMMCINNLYLTLIWICWAPTGTKFSLSANSLLLSWWPPHMPPQFACSTQLRRTSHCRRALAPRPSSSRGSSWARCCDAISSGDIWMVENVMKTTKANDV